jgi:hypothetical protein
LQVQLTWNVLSKLPVYALKYELSEMECPARGAAETTKAFASRLVYTKPYGAGALGDDRSSSSSNQVARLRLLYSLRLEIPMLGGPTIESQQQPRLESSIEIRQRPSLVSPFVRKSDTARHITSQGLPCPNASHPPRGWSMRRIRIMVTSVKVKALPAVGELELVQRPVESTCIMRWKAYPPAVGTIPRTRVGCPEADYTFFLPIGADGGGHESVSLVVAPTSSAPETDMRGIIILTTEHLSRLPLNWTDYRASFGDQVHYDACRYLEADLEAMARTWTLAVGVQELCPIVVSLRMCIEETTMSVPYMLSLDVREAQSLKGCSELGQARIPGLKKRHVHSTVRVDKEVWHVGGATWGDAHGRVRFEQPRVGLPLYERKDRELDLILEMRDHSGVPLQEMIAATRLQTRARVWLARRRVMRVRETRHRRWRTWCALADVTCAVMRWGRRFRTKKAVALIQRVVRGYIYRRRLRRMVHTSKVVIHLADLRYVALEDDTVHGVIDMHCKVAWNGRTVQQYDLKVSMKDGAAFNEALVLPLKKVLVYQSQLYVEVKGEEHHAVDSAELSITLFKKAALSEMLSADVHVARLTLDKWQLRDLCQVIGTPSQTRIKTYHRLQFRVVPDETSTMNAIFGKTKRDNSRPHPNFAFVGMMVESTRPLWVQPILHEDEHEAEVGQLEDLEQPLSFATKIATEVVHEVVRRAAEVIRTTPLAVRLFYGKDFPRLMGSKGMLKPYCVLIWDGVCVGSMRLRQDEDPAKQWWIPQSPLRDDWVFKLPAPASTDPELTLILYNQGLFGKVLLSAISMTAEEVRSLQRITRTKWFGIMDSESPSTATEILLETYLDTSKATSTFKVTAPATLGLGVYKDLLIHDTESLSPTHSSSESGPQPSPPPEASSKGAEDAGTASPPTSAPIDTPSPPVGGAQPKSNEEPATSQQKEEPVAPQQKDPWVEEFSAEYNRPFYKNTETGEVTWTKPGSEGFFGMTGGPTPGWGRATPPPKLSFDPESKLFYFVNESGHRVFQIPKAAIVPPATAEGAKPLKSA